ncbi:MAG: hypothetical protein WCO30_00370 [bacterium]
MTNNEHQDFIDQMIKDRNFRLKMVRESHYWFFHYYFSEYVTCPTADFQRQIFALTEDETTQNLLITAFRGSAKSSIVTLSYVIWSILGKQSKKFPLILGRTQESAQTHLQNIKYQFENNSRLRADLGPFKEEVGPWGSKILSLPNYGAKISTASTGQSIRGIRNNQYRPDLLVADDIEDGDSVKTQEGRDDMYRWFTSDVIPAGDQNTRMIFIGTPLHYDSVLMRICRDIESGKIKGKICRFPFLNEQGDPLWKEKFKTKEDVDREHSKVMSEISWQREYLLNLVTEADQIVKPEWLKYYDKSPERNASNGYRYSVISVDPAVSEKETADCTAVTFADVFSIGSKTFFYIKPKIINKRLLFGDIIKLIETEVAQHQEMRLVVKVIVEEVGAQGYILQQLKDKGIIAIGYRPHTADKAERLTAITPYIQDGRILFPTSGVGILKNQIFGFGHERHDDLVDSLTMLIHSVLDQDRSNPKTLVPRNILPNPNTTPKTEKEADIEQMRMKEWERSNFNQMMRLAMRR